MSFFDDASLAFLPSGAAGKDGKAYSIKPTDGTGDFTFSRGSNLSATRISANGLIEKGRENLLTYSNDFSHSSWITSNASLTSGQTGYDGSSNAWTITPNTSNISHHIYKSVAVANNVSTISVYAKYSGYHAQLRVFLIGSDEAYANFDLQNGTKVTSGGISIIDSTITNVGNGWYRLTLTLNYSGSYSGGIVPIESPTMGEMPAYAGDGTSAIIIQDFQLEQGLAATEYIESGATTGKAGLLEDEPRFDYSGDCPSLLLEPSRTNAVSNSEYFGTWSIVTAGTAQSPTITTNHAISPDGNKNATRIQFDLNGGTTTNDRVVIRQSLTAQTDYYFSVWMKSATGTDQKILWHSNTDSNETTITNEWQRFEYDRNSQLIGWGGLSLKGATSSVNTADILVWGFQAEQGSYPTSYIPNHSGGTITRGADGSTTGDISSLVNSPEGTIFTEFAKIQDFSSFQLDDRTQNNRITLYPRNNTTQITFIFAVGGVEVIRQNPSPSGLDTSQFNKYAIAWGLNDFRVYVNGVNIYTSTSNITFGSGALDDVDFYGGKHRQLLLFPEALSDADCITLTTI